MTFRAAQGEVNIRRIEQVPKGTPLGKMQPENGRYILGHSESGHHHVIDAAGATVMEQPGAPAGMRVLYALLDEPNALKQDAASPHEEIALEPGLYEVRISREYNPFAEQARRVAD